MCPTPPRGVNYARRKRGVRYNKLIREHEDTLAGIEATDVVQRNNVLVFSGEFYLDEQGLPTPKSTAVFNMFKYLAHELSDKYHLVD
ncbi:MAG: YciN family protein [Klebsiella sp.]|nr:YciN family protein [Klebsiella sp.]